MDKRFIAYLSQPCFTRLVSALVAQYRRLGHLGGTIKLDNLTLEEQEAMGGLLGLDLSSGNLNINYAKLKKQLELTKYGECSLKECLEAVIGEPLMSHKQVRHHMKSNFETFQASFPKETWLVDFFEKDIRAKRLFEEDATSLKQVLDYVLAASKQLPDRKELLPVFSQRITKDSHYFDGGFAYDLLLRALGGVDDCVLLNANLFKDDVSNYCMICHIKPIIPSAWDGFYERFEPWNMNLYNLQQLHAPFVPMPIFIFENPAVFRSLCVERYPVGLVCGNGQINTATYLLLDRLAAGGCTLFYAGDFDPEGLVIASKIKARYPDSILIGYDEFAFEKIKVSCDLSQSRLTMLQNIECEDVEVIKQKILETSMVGYQEGLLEEYKAYIEQYLFLKKNEW